MRRHFLAVAATCVLGLLVGQAWAQAGEGAGRKAGREGARKGGEDRPARPDRARELYDRLISELKLTEKQDAPVRQILDTYRKEMTQWMEQNAPVLRELQTKLRGGRGDRPGAEGEQAPKAPTDEERKQAMEKYRELMKQRSDKLENLYKQLKDHLTEEQMAVARKLLGGGRGESAVGVMSMAALERLGLDDAQKAKVKEIMDAARQAAENKEGRERYQPMREAWDKVVKEVLTAEQRTKLEEMRRTATQRRPGGSMFEGLDLNEEQKGKVQTILEAARKKAVEGQDAQARRNAYTEAYREIAEKVLTAEQREKLEQRRREMRERSEGGRGSRPAEKDRGQSREPVIVD